MPPSIIAIKDFFPENVTAFYTTRSGGFSKHPYSDFNLADNVGDNSNLVKRNREFLIRHIKCKPVWLRQVHGNNVYDIDSIVDQEFVESTLIPPVADASITSMFYRSSVVITADCLPILITSHEGTLVGSIHCGWKGLLNKVINVFFESFFNKLNQPKKPSENIIYVWLGPCISQEFYAVGPDLKERFVKSKIIHKDAFKVFENQNFLDIRHIAQHQIKEVLERYNVNVVFNSNDMCTYDNGNLFFSYRRESRTGRHASLIFKNKT